MTQVALLPIIRRINITFGVLEPEQLPVAMEEEVEQETVRARCLCTRSTSESARVCLTVRCKVTMAFFITFSLLFHSSWLCGWGRSPSSQPTNPTFIHGASLNVRVMVLHKQLTGQFASQCARISAAIDGAVHGVHHSEDWNTDGGDDDRRRPLRDPVPHIQQGYRDRKCVW
jgi:hypothetical protein